MLNSTIDASFPALIGCRLSQLRPAAGGFQEISSATINYLPGIFSHLITVEHAFSRYEKGDIFEVRQANQAGNVFVFTLLPHRLTTGEIDICRLVLGRLIRIEVPPQNRPDRMPRPLILLNQHKNIEAIFAFEQELNNEPVNFSGLASRLQKGFNLAPDVAMESTYRLFAKISELLQLEREPVYPIIIKNNTSPPTPASTLPYRQTRTPRITTATAVSEMIDLLLTYICVQSYFKEAGLALKVKQKMETLKSVEQALVTTTKSHLDSILLDINARALTPHELTLQVKRDFFMSILLIELMGTEQERNSLRVQLLEINNHYGPSTGESVIKNAIVDALKYFTPMEERAQSGQRANYLFSM